MKALPTQFDNRRLATAVATPTCSSCCCCCCCLATSIASSTLLAQRIGREGEKHKVPNRHLLTVIAGLFMPIVGFLVYIGFWTVNSLLTSCTEHTYTTTRVVNETYEVCTNSGSGLSWIILIAAPIIVLWYLYSSVHIPRPWRRATLVTFLIAVTFTLEMWGGALLILTGVGGIVYLASIPIVVGWITVWYHKHLGRQFNDQPQAAALQQVHPIEKAYEDPPQPTPPTHDQPPQQQPPAAGSQQ